MGIPVSSRLRANRDFLKVRNQGRRVHTAPFILNVCAASELLPLGPDAPARLGIVASRRVGNAVKRNYGKRLMREIFRKHQATLPGGLDVVVVLRPGYDRCDFAGLEQEFCRALGQLTRPMGNHKELRA